MGERVCIALPVISFTDSLRCGGINRVPNRERILEAANRRYHEDPSYRAATRERARRRYQNDAAYKKYTLDNARERGRKLREDQEFQESASERAKSRRKRLRRLKPLDDK